MEEETVKRAEESGREIEKKSSTKKIEGMLINKRKKYKNWRKIVSK